VLSGVEIYKVRIVTYSWMLKGHFDLTDKSTNTYLNGKHHEVKMGLKEYELDFMDKLWEAANRLRGKMEAPQYKHIVLPLIFPSVR